MLVSKTGPFVASMALLLAGPAVADVTPDEVWRDLERYFADMGYTLNAAQSRSGGALRLSDVSLRMAFPEGEGEMIAQLGEVLLTPSGGAVDLALPSRFPVILTVTPQDDEDIEDVDMTWDVSLAAPVLTVSGDPDDTTWDYAFDSIGMTLSELMVDGAAMGPEAVRANIVAGPVSGTSRMALVQGLRNIDQQMNLGDVTFDLFGQDPEERGGASIAGAVTGLTSRTDASLPQDSAQDMPDLLGAGFDVQAALGWDSSQTAFSATEDGDRITGSTRSGSGTLDVAMGPGGARYDLQTTDLAVEIAPTGLPFPATVGMDSLRMAFDGPVAPAEAPQDFGLVLTLGGITASDAIWGMIDPGGVLPRDPATLSLDLSGKATPYVSFFDPAAMAALETGNVKPGELNALTLNALTVDAAGARLTGEGAFTFDNSDLESFDGMPAPEGQVDLALTGVNGLIDKLMTLGLVDQAQAMGARMMMGMFAVPGDTEDSLTSTIKVNGRGQILANGQRIK